MIYDSPGFSIGSCLLGISQNYCTPQLKCVRVAELLLRVSDLRPERSTKTQSVQVHDNSWCCCSSLSFSAPAMMCLLSQSTWSEVRRNCFWTSTHHHKKIGESNSGEDPAIWLGHMMIFLSICLVSDFQTKPYKIYKQVSLDAHTWFMGLEYSNNIWTKPNKWLWWPYGWGMNVPFCFFRR